MSPPGPGPISSTVSPALGAERVGDAAEDPGIGEEMLAEPALGPGHRQIRRTSSVRSSSGCAPNASASASTACDDRLGRLGPAAAHLVQQPLLAERLARLVPRVDQPVGPEHQQIVVHDPGHLPPLDAARRGEPERRRGGLEPLGLAEPGHAERVGVPRVGVGQPAGRADRARRRTR